MDRAEGHPEDPSEARVPVTVRERPTSNRPIRLVSPAGMKLKLMSDPSDLPWVHERLAG